jgi:hypothetical protein
LNCEDFDLLVELVLDRQRYFEHCFRLALVLILLFGSLSWGLFFLVKHGLI